MQPFELIDQVDAETCNINPCQAHAERDPDDEGANLPIAAAQAFRPIPTEQQRILITLAACNDPIAILGCLIPLQFSRISFIILGRRQLQACCNVCVSNNGNLSCASQKVQPSLNKIPVP